MRLNVRNKFLIPVLSLMTIGISILALVSYTTSKASLTETIHGQLTQIILKRERTIQTTIR